MSGDTKSTLQMKLNEALALAIELESQLACEKDEIGKLERENWDLRDQVESYEAKPAIDPFAPRETFDAYYARLHPAWPEQKGTSPNKQVAAEPWQPMRT